MVDPKIDLDARLEKILKEVFQVEKIDLNFSMDEIPEWDSFKHYELIVAVENEFKIFSNLVSKSVLGSTIN